MTDHRRRRAGLLAVALSLAVPLAGTPAGGQQAPASPAPGTGVALATFGYGETDIRGAGGRADLSVPLPPGTKAGGETLVELDISHSPLLLPRSTLTVLAGGISLASTVLTAANVSHGRVTARVPAELFGPNGLALSVRTFLRMTEDDCEDPDNPALWVTVHASSTVQLGLQAQVRNLDDAAALLTGNRPNRGVVIGLPPSPDPDVLRAAGIVAAQVGRWQADQRTDALVGLSAPGDGTGPDVVLAAGAASSPGFPAPLTGSAGGGEHGILALAQEGPPRLLVGGATPAALVEAAGALDRVAGGPTVALTGEPSVGITERAAPWRDGAASFAQLGIDRREVIGYGAHEITMQIDRPPSWRITGRPRLDLVVDTSPTLAADRSSIQVQLEGFDLGHRRMRRGDGPHTYTFDLPAGLIDRRLDGRAVRSLDLTVRLVLEGARTACQPAAEAPGAAVLPTSAFRLPHDDVEGRELARFPHPLTASPPGAAATPVMVVLPRSPGDDVVAAGLQLCAGIGRWAEPGTPPPVLVTADRLDPEERIDRSLVLVGDADRQVLGRPVDIGRGAVIPAAGEVTAVMGLAPSPLNDDRSVLVIHGDGPGLLLAARTLASRAGLATLRGSRISLAGARPATLADVDGATPPPELAPVLGGASFVSGNSWAVPAVVLLAGFLVALVLLVRFRWFSGRHSKRPKPT